jgi:hypothetical protein
MVINTILINSNFPFSDLFEFFEEKKNTVFVRWGYYFFKGKVAQKVSKNITNAN